MIKVTMKLSLAAVCVCVLALGAHAAPLTLSDAQMDSVAAAGVDTTDGFVCPVITTDAVLNSPDGAVIGGGDYSVIGPDVMVPILATNADGAGTPGGAHAAPGDTNYTAIWAD